ncbi:hypothetical protein [Clostridium sp. HBUAS56017]|uniref:hypothetical protein n=1 Tax=Clostridium sp. HBUAS56017 TaxID=2571128 RepID=UPI001178B33B|nr:hypothetical protein [Clostridium sp. HBUAS56017]
MMRDKDNTYEDDMEFVDFEISPMPYEPLQREPPFIPMPNDMFPPIDNYDNYPKGNFYPPGTDFEAPVAPHSPPPNYIPSKKDKGVQSFYGASDNIQTKAVDPMSIRFCLFKYTYIWETNGRSYWAFLINVSRVSISGFRWRGRNWVYFGLSLRRIDSFVCYRSDTSNACENCINSEENNTPSIYKKDYYLNGSRNVFTETLASIDIPEVTEDLITQTIGYIDNNNIQTEVPCTKIRNIGYRINLEVTYPSNYDSSLKKEINNLCEEASTELHKIISSTRNTADSSTPLETFNSSVSLIPNLLNTFTTSFNSKFNILNSSRSNYDITCSIRKEIIQSDWKPYYNNIYYY